MYNVNASLPSEWPVGDVSLLIAIVISGLLSFVVLGMAFSGLGMLGRLLTTGITCLFA